MKGACRAPGVLLAAGFLLAGVCRASERAGTVTFSIDVNAPAGTRTVKLWFPYPASDLDQTIKNLHFRGNCSNFPLAHEPRSGALYLCAEWTGPMKKRTMTVTVDARAKERKAAKVAENGDSVPPEARKYLLSDFWIPSDERKVSWRMTRRRASLPGSCSPTSVTP